MVNFQRAAALFIVVALSVPAYADQAKTAFNEGVRAERQANYDDAYADYKQAATLAPTNPKYLAAYSRMRFNASARHVHVGQLLRNTGALPQAMAQFRRALDIDSTNVIARQEMEITTEMIDHQERQRAAAKAQAPPIFKLQEGDGQSIALQPLSNARMTIHLTANADTAYKTIGKLAGLNVIIDPDYKGQKITVDLNDVTLRDALEVVRLQSKTFWRPVLSNTILVGSDSPTKRKELEQSVMKTFYLQNVSSQNELQEAANTLRQILDIGHIQLLQGQDALIVRGTPDQLVLAEKLLTDMDKPKSEVMIDVTVMQVSRDRIRNLGTTVPTSASVTLGPQFFGGTSGANGSSGSASGGIPIGSFVVSVPTASVTALASESNTKILQNPRIRALNNEKATLRIGDRVPIATGSFQPGISGGGSISPLIGTQFTYLDVGVNIDITPHIHSDDAVTLKMSLEISSVTGQQDIGGISQPIIGQRRIEHETRLTDGEVNLVGGILEDSETKSLSGYPWLSKIPMLKYLFAQDNRDRTENEIVFAITPHIVRAIQVNDQNRREIEIGTGSSIELRRAAPPAPASATGHGSDPAKGGEAVPQTPTSGRSPARVSPQSTLSQVNPPAQTIRQ
jgi:general secretion pathway protein D